MLSRKEVPQECYLTGCRLTEEGKKKSLTSYHPSRLLCSKTQEGKHTFPDFHLISVDFEDGSPLSFKWNSLESTLFSKYGFSSKY